MRRFLLGLLLIIVLLVGGLVVWGVNNNKLEGGAPDVILSDDITHVGKNTQLLGELVDNDSGLREAKISIVQNHREIVLWESNWHTQLISSQDVVNRQKIDLSINAQELGLVQGPATLIVESRDNSWRRWGRGNLSIKEIPVTVVLAPPKATLLSSNIYVNRSGVGVVVYRVSESTTKHGVQLGGDFYPGYAAWPASPDIRVCYFAYPDTLDRNAQAQLVAMDPAGNSNNQNVPMRVRWREFSTDTINLSDGFLQIVAERFAKIAPPGTPLEIFQWVNNDLRRQSQEILKQAVSGSEPRQLWRGAFLRPSGKMMSNFVERRKYTYNGNEVGTSTHYGLDLADVAQTPVRASADGKIVFAGDMGVYGNSIVIDHGLNLFTLYAHLSSMNVTVGENVNMGHHIGNSGSTGFSFGDHLHYSCLIGDKFVTPYEWLDSHWIVDNVEEQYRQAGMSAPN